MVQYQNEHFSDTLQDLHRLTAQITSMRWTTARGLLTEKINYRRFNSFFLLISLTTSISINPTEGFRRLLTNNPKALMKNYSRKSTALRSRAIQLNTAFLLWPCL
jgi:hypothetical protein